MYRVTMVVRQYLLVTLIWVVVPLSAKFCFGEVELVWQKGIMVSSGNLVSNHFHKL